MTEDQALNILRKHYPDLKIYGDEYTSMLKTLGKDMFELRNFCKESGLKSIDQWLKKLKLTVNVERDMRREDIDHEGITDVYDLAEEAFRCLPLIGNICIDEETEKLLFKEATDVFDRIVDELRISYKQGRLLTFAIIVLLRNDSDKEEDESFWAYIYRQFGYNIENMSQGVYAALRATLKDTLNTEKRFFAPENTHRYYTSLMLHSLSPRYSIEGLFEILLYFYTDELKYTYIPEDSAFSALVDSIANRWNKTEEIVESIHVRGNVLASGLRVLFQERPLFMRHFCEEIIRKTDALVRDPSSGNQMHGSYLDELLSKWFLRKNSDLRDKWNAERSGTVQTGKAKNISQIRLRYVMKNNVPKILVPATRLETAEDEDPLFILYQGDKKTGCISLETYGKLSRTIRACEIPLTEFDMDYDQLAQLHAELIYNGKSLLANSSMLARDILIFDKSGNEITRQSVGRGRYVILAGESAEMQFSDDVDAVLLNHPGQLYDLCLQEESSVRVNGTEINTPASRKTVFHHYSSVQQIKGACTEYEGYRMGIYPSPPHIVLHMRSDEPALKYRIDIDGTEDPLSALSRDKNNDFIVQIPNNSSGYHRIRVIDWSNAQTVYEFRYAVAQGFSYHFDSSLYIDNGMPVEGEIICGGKVNRFSEYPEADEDVIYVNPDGLETSIILNVPMVRCLIEDKNIFDYKCALWYDEINPTAFIHVSLPEGAGCILATDDNEIIQPDSSTKNTYAIGSLISVFQEKKQELGLSLIVRSASFPQPVPIYLVKIVFRPTVFHSPLVTNEERSVAWQPDGNIICSKDAMFRMVIHIPAEDGEYFTYNYLSMKRENLCREFPYKLGRFPYEIYLQGKQSFFGKEDDELIYSGELVFGEECELKLLGKMIRLVNSKGVKEDPSGIWRPEIIHLTENAAWIGNFTYKGVTEVWEENMWAPQFNAVMYFRNPRTMKLQKFNDNKHADDYDIINPITFWLLNNRVLLLKTVMAEQVEIDREYCSIVNRKPYFAGGLKEELRRIHIPDTFEYELVEEQYD